MARTLARTLARAGAAQRAHSWARPALQVGRDTQLLREGDQQGARPGLGKPKHGAAAGARHRATRCCAPCRRTLQAGLQGAPAGPPCTLGPRPPLLAPPAPLTPLALAGVLRDDAQGATGGKERPAVVQDQPQARQALVRHAGVRPAAANHPRAAPLLPERRRLGRPQEGHAAARGTPHPPAPYSPLQPPTAPCTPHTPSHPSHTPRRSTRSRSKCTRRPRTTRSSSRSTTRRCRSRAPYLTPRSWASSASAAARCTWASASGAACSTRCLALAAPPLPPLLAALGGATAGWLPRPPGTQGLGCGLRHATAPRHALQRSQPHLAP